MAHNEAPKDYDARQLLHSHNDTARLISLTKCYSGRLNPSQLILGLITEPSSYNFIQLSKL